MTRQELLNSGHQPSRTTLMFVVYVVSNHPFCLNNEVICIFVLTVPAGRGMKTVPEGRGMTEGQAESLLWFCSTSVVGLPEPFPILQPVPGQRFQLSLDRRRTLTAFIYPLFVKGKAAIRAHILLTQQQPAAISSIPQEELHRVQQLFGFSGIKHKYGDSLEFGFVPPEQARPQLFVSKGNFFLASAANVSLSVSEQKFRIPEREARQKPVGHIRG